MVPPQKIKNRTTMCSSNPRTWYIPKGKIYLSQQDICTPVFTAVLFTVAKIWKLNCPLTKKMCGICIHIHNEILFGLKKNGHPAICNMDESGRH